MHPVGSAVYEIATLSPCTRAAYKMPPSGWTRRSAAETRAAIPLKNSFTAATTESRGDCAEDVVASRLMLEATIAKMTRLFNGVRLL